MYNINFFCNNVDGSLLPDVLKYFLDGDYKKVQDLIDNGYDLNKKIVFGKFKYEASLLEIACVQNDDVMFDFLIDNGFVVSDTYDKSLLYAARFCRPGLFLKRLKYLKTISFEDALELLDHTCSYGNYVDNIDLLDRKGIKIFKYGGSALLNAAWNGKKWLVKKLIKGGVDVNFHMPDMVFPYAPTALILAIKEGHLDIARYLIKKGADINIMDIYGNGPIDVAIKKGYIKFVDYLRKFESKEAKIEREKIKSEFDLPEELIKFMKSSKSVRRITFSKNCCTKFVEFYSYDNMIWFDYKKKTVIDLVASIDNYSSPIFVFNPKDSKVYGIDIEHGIFRKLATWNKFYDNMEYYVNGFLRGDFDK